MGIIYLFLAHKASKLSYRNSVCYEGYLLPLVSILLYSLAAVIAFYFFSGMIWGVGYTPTAYNEIERAGKLLDLNEGDTLYDLGCGYGRVIFRIAQTYGANCVGVEADPIKCWWIRRMIRRKKLDGKVSLIQSNLLDIDLKGVDNVFIFLTRLTPIMKRLQKKVLSEMRPGSRIVSYVHRFDNWEPTESLGELYLYTIPLKGEQSQT